MQRGKQYGFTLIELMITLAIVAILAAVAYPSYASHIIKSNRAAAKAQMLDIANREQQFMLASRAYVPKPALEASGYALPAEVSTKYTYTITVGSGTVPDYLITFNAIGSQLSDGDLTLNSEGVKTPSSKW